MSLNHDRPAIAVSRCVSAGQSIGHRSVQVEKSFDRAGARSRAQFELAYGFLDDTNGRHRTRRLRELRLASHAKAVHRSAEGVTIHGLNLRLVMDTHNQCVIGVEVQADNVADFLDEERSRDSSNVRGGRRLPPAAVPSRSAACRS